MRGEVYELPAPRGGRGHEQNGRRYAVVVQSDALLLSTWLVCPTSTQARPADFRPEIELLGATTRVLAEQTAAIDPQRLGKRVAQVSYAELQAIDAALRLALDL